MSHDNSKKYDDDLALRTETEYMTYKLRQGFRSVNDESLMEQAKKRQLVKSAARRAKKYHHEHALKVLVAELVFVALSFAGIRMFRKKRRHKS